jgi:hypothetical protein
MAMQKKTGEVTSEVHDSSEQDIRERAYQLFCESGYQHGHDREHWLEAERQVTGRKKPKLRSVA